MKNILPEMKSCNIHDSEIQYLHYKGSGNALVLLHATGFNPWLWHPIARELVSGFDIYAPYFC
ncbi:MAG: alpha/beta hydrolase, partial [Spirochaetota bacterium]